MKRTLILIFLLSALGISPSRAGAGDTVDFGEMELGTAYQLESDFSNYVGHFTAPASGTLTVHSSSSGNFMSPFADNELTESLPFSIGYTSDGGCTYDLTVEEGKTYHFAKDFSMTRSTTTLTMDAGTTLTLESITPEAGSRLSPGGSGIFSIIFNKAVQVAGASLVMGAHESPLAANILGTMVSIQYKETLMDALRQGIVSENDAVVLRLTGICSTANPSLVYGTHGTLEVSFTSAGLPVSLVRTDGLEGAFRSWWPTGDETAVYRMEFDGELNSSPDLMGYAQISYGNAEGEAGEYYVEQLPYAVNGNVLTIDFSGKLRRPQDMVASGTDYGTMLLRLVGVRDAHGDYVYSSGLGTLGSFDDYFAYEEVKSNVIPEFTPKSGSSLDGADHIEIWLTDYASVRHDGILFHYTLNGEEQFHVVRDFTATPDAGFEGAYALQVPVPEAVKAQALDPITVSLHEAVFADGVDHNPEIRATYHTTGTASGIEKTTAPDGNPDTTYDLNGRKAHPGTRGIHIREGQKILVR